MVALLPAHIAPLPLTVAVGFVYVVTANGAEVAEQPDEFVMVTVYVPAEWTVMFAVVSPVDQRYVFAGDCGDPRMTEPPPGQNGIVP
jgi:hypothetical protein